MWHIVAWHNGRKYIGIQVDIHHRQDASRESRTTETKRISVSLVAIEGPG